MCLAQGGHCKKPVVIRGQDNVGRQSLPQIWISQQVGKECQQFTHQCYLEGPYPRRGSPACGLGRLSSLYGQTTANRSFSSVACPMWSVTEAPTQYSGHHGSVSTSHSGSLMPPARQVPAPLGLPGIKEGQHCQPKALSRLFYSKSTHLSVVK